MSTRISLLYVAWFVGAVAAALSSSFGQGLSARLEASADGNGKGALVAPGELVTLHLSAGQQAIVAVYIAPISSDSDHRGEPWLYALRKTNSRGALSLSDVIPADLAGQSFQIQAFAYVVETGEFLKSQEIMVSVQAQIPDKDCARSPKCAVFDGLTPATH